MSIGGRAIDGIDYKNPIALGQRAGATCVLDQQVAAAIGLTAIHHQLVRGRTVAVQVRVQGKGAIGAVVVVDAQVLVAAADWRAEVDQAGLVAQGAEVRVAGQVPQAAVAQIDLGTAARSGARSAVEHRACDIDVGVAGTGQRAADTLPLAGAHVWDAAAIAGHGAVDVQPLAAATDDTVSQADVGDACDSHSGPVAVLQHAAVEIGLALEQFGALRIKRCGLVTGGVDHTALGVEARTVLGHSGVGQVAAGVDPDLIELNIGLVVRQRSQGTLAVGSDGGVAGAQ
ncbi:hypothetical protein D3C76_1129340 [compost metagenome]